MAESPVVMDLESQTVAATLEEGPSGSGNTPSTMGRTTTLGIHMQLTPAPIGHHVQFHADVVDNEHMNRRKSKCCCIYRKPHAFGESSSSSDDECDNCCGHPEMRHINRLKKQKQSQ